MRIYRNGVGYLRGTAVAAILETMTTFHLVTNDRDPERRALILPGSNYVAQAPLLWYAEEVLGIHGWTTEAFVWNGTPESRTEVRMAYDMVLRQRTAVESGAMYCVVGKSLGTLVLPTAVDLEVPGVWLTPLLSEEQAEVELHASVREIGALGIPALFIGGTADPAWDGEIARGGGTVLEVPGATHRLEIPGDWRASLTILTGVASAIDNFVSGLE